MSDLLCVAVVKGIQWSPPSDVGVKVSTVEVGQECPACSLVLVDLHTLKNHHIAFSAANAIFVLLPDSGATADLWTLPNIVGFGRTTDDHTWQEITHVLKELQERTNTQQAEAATGCVEIQEQTSPSDIPFTSHFHGVMRKFYQDLHDILLNLRPLEPTDFQHPFRGVSSRQWLDFYGHSKSGAFLDSDEAKRVWGEIQDKIGNKKTQKEKGEQIFEEIFYHEQHVHFHEPLLILGETGVGKTVVAKMLHQRLLQHMPARPAYKPPLTQINCAGLGNLLESELFGAMTGAFTGAEVTNPGKIIASYGGIVFLDEIGTMSKKAQEKLLVYLDRGEVAPEGWTEKPLRVPVHIVAATNADLLDEVQKGNFRQDLYYRFKRRLHIPPVRERGREDLELLIHSILSDDAVNSRLTDGNRTIQKVSNAAWEKLRRHDYPGNFRELQNVLQAGVNKAARMRSDMILATDIEFEKSPLPQQHSVIGIIKAQHDGQDWFLLRFNSNWYNYFLIGGRFEADKDHTFESALQRELDEKLGLKPGQYDLGPVDIGGEVKLIQYSDRDKKLKHYTFHLYGVLLKEDPWAGKDLKKLGLLWVTHEHIQHERGPAGEKISPTIEELAARANSFADFPSFPLHVR